MMRHLSSEEFSRWTIGERTGETERHVLVCTQCRSEIDRLQETFSLFRESGIRWSDRCYPDRFGAESEFLAFSPATKRRGRLFVPCAAALAASILIAVLVLSQPSPTPQAQFADRRGETPFVEIPYVAPLAPYERAAITRMEVPVTALIAAGFEVHVADVNSTVRADVLFGQDGRAHAIRLVPDPLTDSDRRWNP